MSRWRTLLRYDWPLHFVLWFTNWLPDNVIFFRLRGWLARSFLGHCGKDLRLGRNLSFYNPSNIYLGSHVYIAYGCDFIAAGEKILIEDEVLFGPYCVLASQNHTRQQGSYRYGTPQSGAIHVMRGSWLSAHVTVTAGSQVGSGTVIAAGAVVTSSIPDNVIAGGVPAKIIKKIYE